MSNGFWTFTKEQTRALFEDKIAAAEDAANLPGVVLGAQWVVCPVCFCVVSPNEATENNAYVLLANPPLCPNCDHLGDVARFASAEQCRSAIRLLSGLDVAAVSRRRWYHALACLELTVFAHAITRTVRDTIGDFAIDVMEEDFEINVKLFDWVTQILSEHNDCVKDWICSFENAPIQMKKAISRASALFMADSLDLLTAAAKGGGIAVSYMANMEGSGYARSLMSPDGRLAEYQIVY